MRTSDSPGSPGAAAGFRGYAPPAADKAKDFYDKGQDAEARQNYETAFDLYKQAYDLKPKDLRYRAAYERREFLAGASHVHRGQLLRDGGQAR